MIGVVIPAHNESRTIEACLRSVRMAAAHSVGVHARAYVVVVADGCTDDTAERARRWADVVLTRNVRCVGSARAEGCAAALDAGCTWIANTDADTTVPASWLLTHASCAADVFCGTVRLGLDQAIDDQLRAAYEAGYLHRDGHQHVHGANLGISARSFRAIGGFQRLQCHEDVALVKAAAAYGCSIRWSAAAPVITSARLVGRAEGGFASHLQNLSRASGKDSSDATGRLQAALVTRVQRHLDGSVVVTS